MAVIGHCRCRGVTLAPFDRIRQLDVFRRAAPHDDVRLILGRFHHVQVITATGCNSPTSSEGRSSPQDGNCASRRSNRVTLGCIREGWKVA
jgi:hypothetical protein